MKILSKILIVLILLLSIVLYLICDACFIAPSRITTRNTVLADGKIPAGLDGMRIVCFSDLDYGTYFNEARLNKLVDHINDLSPDVILFLGDLYDTGVKTNEAQDPILTEAFRRLDAPYGKFAVLGDRDTINEQQKTAVEKILYNADFEILNNSSLPIHHGGSASITLVGLENDINGTPDITAAYENVSRNTYVLTMSHTPDTADHVPTDLTNYYVAGHTHGGQIYYSFGSLIPAESEGSYLRGLNEINGSFTLDITSGVGTTIQDIRFLSNAETVLYVLQSTTEAEAPKPSVQPAKPDSDASAEPEDSTNEVTPEGSELPEESSAEPEETSAEPEESTDEQSE